MGIARSLDLAVHASTLSERMRVVDALRDAGADAGPPVDEPALDPVDVWRLDRLATKLADKFQQESRHRSVPARHTKDELLDVLTTYRRFELTRGHADETMGALLDMLHEAWLPTYRATLERWHRREAADRATWRQDDVYYGRLAKACEPFLAELGRRLESVRARLPGSIAIDLVDDLQRHLHDRFALALAWSVEADANVHCAQNALDREQADQAAYLRYLDATFDDAESYHRFFLKFPVLGRWLAHVTDLLSTYGGEILNHLAQDADLVGDTFFAQPIAEFRSVRLGTSDYHAGGRSVALVDVLLEDGTIGSFYFKPRCLRSEAAMQTMLARLNTDGAVEFATRPVLAMDGYGYEAVIPTGRNAVDSTETASHVYEELGGYLALFYVLGGGDLHFENIIVSEGHAFVCDAETVFGVFPRGRGRTEGTMLDSVFKTGLLEWPRAEPDDGAARMKVSGYSGGEQYEMPVPVPRLNDRRMSFAASVEHRAGIHVEPTASNRVFLHGEIVQPQDHTQSIMDGFDRVYEWFERNPDGAIASVSETFVGSSARFINWGTQIYSQLLSTAQHPKCLAEPLEVDLLANTVRTFPRTWDHECVLAERETASMWQLDVPIFTVDVHGKELVHDHTNPLQSTLDVSSMDHAAERIRRLSPSNRAQQGQYIAASLSVGEISSSAFVSTSLDYATRIGSRLCQMLREPSAPAPWTSFQLTGDTLEEADIEGDLYQGSAGVALFLAYLDDLAPRPEFRQAARRALEHALSDPNPERTGAFSGLGGQLYLLTHLYNLWGDEELLTRASELCEGLPARIAEDTHFDVLHGAAGLIPVLLGLAPALEGPLEIAHQCAEHLLRHSWTRDDALSWPSFTPDDVVTDLTGFSHGSGGIGWALILLGAHTGRSDYVDAGKRAFAYENQHFDPDEQDWYDLRKSTGHIAKNGHHFANAWCNGAAGIGLSRIDSWAALGKEDEQLLREAHQGLSATLRNFPRLKNHTLCHGTAGNSELLVRFAQLRSEPAFQLEANVQVQALWRNLDDAENGIAENSANFFPGLMLGISGFGMHFLRIAHPDRVPSVLLLDPPRS